VFVSLKAVYLAQGCLSRSRLFISLKAVYLAQGCLTPPISTVIKIFLAESVDPLQSAL